MIDKKATLIKLALENPKYREKLQTVILGSIY